MKKWALVYVLISLFCLLFGAVYEIFSHNVYSNYMIYAFLIPLVGGTLVSLILDCVSKKTMPGKVVFNLYNSGLAALTVGSILHGALDIYGTSNPLILIFWIAGFCFITVGVAAYIAGLIFRNRQNTALRKELDRNG